MNRFYLTRLNGVNKSEENLAHFQTFHEMFHRPRGTKCRITVWTLIYVGWTMSSVTVLVIFLMAVHGQPPGYAKGSDAAGQIAILGPGESAAGEVDGISVRESPILRLENSRTGDNNNFAKDFALGNRVILEQRPVKIYPRREEEDSDSPSLYDNSNIYGFDARVGHDSKSSVDGRLKERFEGERDAAWAGTNSSALSRSRRRTLTAALRANFANVETQIQHSGKGGEGTDQVYQEVAADSVVRKISARSSSGVPVVEDSIFWSREAEAYVPTGLTEESVVGFRRSLESSFVLSMEEPQWNRCGRPKNRFITLSDGTKLCARYRHPQEALVRGEVLSFYLSKYLAFDNVPAVVLAHLSSKDVLWKKQNFTAADWTEGASVALIQWMDDLNHERSRVKMPRLLLSHYESGIAMNAGSLDSRLLTADHLSSLLQWTDLIVFDYITGHYDRVASMQDGAEREMRPSVMAENIRNLRQIIGTGKLVLIDNESGLFDGYELMYHGGAETGLQFLGFHRRLLHSVCVFRRRTVGRLRSLAASPRPDLVLEEYAGDREPVYRKLVETPEVELFRTMFGVRLKEVVTWIDQCASLIA